jgi:hypothetical protein
MSESNAEAMQSGASEGSVIAAPEDRHTPLMSPPPSLTRYEKTRYGTTSR